MARTEVSGRRHGHVAWCAGCMSDMGVVGCARSAPCRRRRHCVHMGHHACQHVVCTRTHASLASTLLACRIHGRPGRPSCCLHVTYFARTGTVRTAARVRRGRGAK